MMYVYEHAAREGHFIKKPDAVMMNTTPGEYFSGPFVLRWKHFESEAEADSWIEQQLQGGLS